MESEVQRSKHDQERLRQRAIELEKSLGSSNLGVNEAVRLAEEYEHVMLRLDQLQTMIDDHTLAMARRHEEQVALVSAEQQTGAVQQLQVQLQPGSATGFQALAMAGHSREQQAPTQHELDKVPDEASLGRVLACEMRDALGPTLADQLGGLDSPLQPPTVISHCIEATLRNHMRRMRRVREAELDQSEQLDLAAKLASRLHLDLAEALLALMRELASNHSGSLPYSGVEKRLELHRIENALVSADEFEQTLLRSGQRAGQQVQVHFRSESLDVPVTYHVTFEQLIETASSYWHIAPLRYVVTDQSGTHFLRRMSVLEALSTAPTGTALHLRPLASMSAGDARTGVSGHTSTGYQYAEVDGGEGKQGLSGRQLQAEVDALIKQRARQQSRLFGKAQALLSAEEDLQENDEDNEIRTRYFGYSDVHLTRFQMLVGVFQTVVLGMLLYYVAYIKTDVLSQRELCSALENSFNMPFEFEVTDALTDLAHVSSMAMFQDFLINSLPYVLYPNCMAGPLALVLCSNETAQQFIEPAPIVVRGKNLLLGGMRLMQTRGQTKDRALCSVPDFIDPTIYFPWSNGTSMLPSELHTPTNEPFVYSTETLTSWDQNNLGEQIRNNLEGQQRPGNVSLCYYDLIDKAPYGPLAPNASQAWRDESAAVDVPAVECYPACPGPGAEYTGILPAFVYQTAEQLGYPYPTVPEFSAAEDGGFALTFSSNLTFYQFRTALTELVEHSWLDRQTLAVGLELTFYNPQMDHLANTQIVTRFTRAGHASVEMNCVAGSVASQAALTDTLEWALGVWLILRTIDVLVKFTWVCWKNLYNMAFNRDAAAEVTIGVDAHGNTKQPVWFNVTPELIVHVITGSLGLAGWILRFIEQQHVREIGSFYEVDDTWPPPFLVHIPKALLSMRYSAQLFGAALLVCVLRLALYYSIISRRLFLMRLTMGRACVKLLPALLFLILAMITFAITGNLLYPTAYPFHDFLTSIGTTVYLLRRPTALPFKDMAHSATLWPVLYTDAPSLVDLLYLVSFTCIVLWILTNLYRTLIINEYAEVLINFPPNQRPGDLKPDPWPDPNPLVHVRKLNKQLAQQRSDARIASRTKDEWQRRLRAQKAKAASVVEEQDRKLEGVATDIIDAANGDAANGSSAYGKAANNKAGDGSTAQSSDTPGGGTAGVGGDAPAAKRGLRLPRFGKPTSPATAVKPATEVGGDVPSTAPLAGAAPPKKKSVGFS